MCDHIYSLTCAFTYCLQWHVDPSTDMPYMLDPDFYGYPGGFLLPDESVYVAYYDAANEQKRTTVWGMRFRVNSERTGRCVSEC